MKDTTKWHGVFEYTLPAYGFVKKLEKPSGDLRAVPPDGIMLRAAEASTTLRYDRHLLAGIDGRHITFSVRESAVYPGKLEAYDVAINDPTFPL